MIDVIIVNFNSTDVLLRCLDSFRNAISLRYVRVDVRDNCSSDGVERIREAYPEVFVNINSRNVGFSRAVNMGLEASETPYVVLLNPDTVVQEGFFPLTVRYMDANPEVGVLGPAVLNPDGTVQGSARAFPSVLTGLFGRTSSLTKLFPNNAITRANIASQSSDGKTPMEVDWVSGACMVVRRKAINDVGLLDPRFFMYWEDADWCRRMWKKGWKVVYFPMARVVHSVGVSSSRKRFRSMYEFHKSSFKLFQKHAGFSHRVMSPFVAFLLSMRFCMVAVVSGIRRLAGYH